LHNLQEAAANEHEEGEVLDPKFAAIAEEEGFDEIANVWRCVSISEKGHEARYLELAQNIIEDAVFKRKNAVMWQCSNCGYWVLATQAPEKCPSCDHPRDYFELKMQNW
jgi:rubrerythrin